MSKYYQLTKMSSGLEVVVYSNSEVVCENVLIDLTCHACLEELDEDYDIGDLLSSHCGAEWMFEELTEEEYSKKMEEIL